MEEEGKTDEQLFDLLSNLLQQVEALANQEEVQLHAKIEALTMAEDPEVRSLLSSTADVWMPVITATSDERRSFTASVGDDNLEKTSSK